MIHYMNFGHDTILLAAHVLFRHVLEHAHFGLRVALHGAVTVEMILGDVQQRAAAGVEGFRGLHLEGADLADEHVAVGAVDARR